MPLMKFTGTYVDVIDSLALPDTFYGPQTRAAYDNQIALDLPRTSYLSYNLTSEQMKHDLSQADDLDVLSFTQGNFDGGVFTNMTIEHFSKRLDWISEHGEISEGSIRVCYTDDNNTINGFALKYLRDDSNLKIAEELRPRYFAAAVINNAAAAPADRTVTYFSHTSMLSADAQNGQEISDADFVEQLNSVLDSKHLSTLLAGIFAGEQVSVAPFNALAARIRSDRNIDNRDVKQEQLKRFIDFATNNLSTDTELQDDLDDVKPDANSETNAYDEKQFKSILNNINIKIDHAINRVDKPRQSDLRTINKLNLWATQLQLTANALKNLTFERQALEYKAAELFAAVDAVIPNLAKYKTLTSEQINQQVEQAVARMNELESLYTTNQQLFSGQGFTSFLENLYHQTHDSISFFNADEFERVIAQFSTETQAKVDDLHLMLKQTITDNVVTLRAIAQGDEPFADNLPDSIKQVFFEKANELELHIGEYSAAKLSNAYSDTRKNSLINSIFSAIQQQETNKIKDKYSSGREYVSEAPKPADNSNFFSRNWPTLGGAVLLIVGFALIASGVFAPIAILFTVLASSAAVTVALGAALKVFSNEVDHKKEFDLVTTLHNDSMRKQLNDFASEEEAALSALATDLNLYKQGIQKVGKEQPEKQPLVNDARFNDEYFLSMIEKLENKLDAGEQQVIDGSNIEINLPVETDEEQVDEEFHSAVEFPYTEEFHDAKDDTVGDNNRPGM